MANTNCPPDDLEALLSQFEKDIQKVLEESIPKLAPAISSKAQTKASAPEPNNTFSPHQHLVPHNSMIPSDVVAVATQKARNVILENRKEEKKKRKEEPVSDKPQKRMRTAGGKTWEDPSLNEWPEDDFRLFIGNLAPTVSEQTLRKTFDPYPSFVKSKVIRDSRTHKSKGYGFLSFLDAKDYLKAFKEWNGKYVGDRPVKLRKSTWKERQIK